MKNARYMVTSVCHRGCEYCISKNVKVLQDNDIVRIANLFNHVSKTYDNLELTGGEPTLDPKLTLKLLLANEYFPTVSVRTAEPKHLSMLECKIVDSINVSAHNLGDYLEKHVTEFFEFRGATKLYLAINDQQFWAGLPKHLVELGWNGLSIWQDVWSSKPKVNLNLEAPEGFSIRHLDSEECLDQFIILPNLDIMSGQEYKIKFLGNSSAKKYTNYPMPMPRLIAGM